MHVRRSADLNSRTLQYREYDSVPQCNNVFKRAPMSLMGWI
jgi:hypothetical protein